MKRSLVSVLVLLACLVTGAVLAPQGPSSAAPAGALAAGDACGAARAKPDGGYWVCTLVDNFNGSALNGQVWSALTKPGHSDLCVVDDRRTVAVQLGKLRLTARRTGLGLQCPMRADGTRASYAGGWVSTYYKWGQQYGRFETRIKVRAASEPGLHEAFWLWPDTRYTSDRPWPASGEIDVVETYSVYPDLAIPHLHYNHDDNGGPVPGQNTAWDCRAPRGQWHTYVLEWTADRLTIVVDGRTCLVNTDGASSFRKPFIMNLTQFLGAGHNAYTGSVALPATMEVDYVKVWR
jgi:beta-glucanase (GH16 family)